MFMTPGGAADSAPAAAGSNPNPAKARKRKTRGDMARPLRTVAIPSFGATPSEADASIWPEIGEGNLNAGRESAHKAQNRTSPAVLARKTKRDHEGGAPRLEENMPNRFAAAMARLPLVAILRGLKPVEA